MSLWTGALLTKGEPYHLRSSLWQVIGSLRKNDSQWRLRKRHLKSKLALPQTLSRLFHRLISQMLANFSGVEF